MYKILSTLFKSKTLSKKDEHGNEVPIGFYDLDSRLQSAFFKNIIIAFVVIIISIILSIWLKTLLLLMLGVIISITMILDTVIKIENCINDKVVEINGIYSPPDEDLSFIESLGNFAKKAVIKSDGINQLYIKSKEKNGIDVIVSAPSRFKADVGNEITLFAPKASIYFKTDNIMVINKVYYIEVTRL